ncbi:MAG: YbhB/YbcL family Raf kinase inhibitor-like protein [Labilithrix sp.]|nr:YbhB/YbcL family Raf kinase inhibitor-like protein [Labilithrix sp.]
MRLLLLSLAAVAACQKPPIEPRYAPGASMSASITVTSPSFREGTRMPVDLTCDGNDVMPEIVLSSPPDKTKSLVIYVEDPDASSGTFTHMIAFNLSPDLRKLPSGSDLSAGGEAARFGLNDFQAARYSGPCPPKGEAHRYRFRVVALDKMLELPEGAPRSQIDEATDGHILGEGTLSGHFGH